MTESIDMESVITNVLSIVSYTALNTKCAAITSQKGDSLTLKEFIASGVAVLTTDAKNMNANPFLYVGASMPAVQAIGSNTASELHIDLVVVLELDNLADSMWKRMLRYQRALKELIQENWRHLEIPGQLMIENLEPRPLEELGSVPYMGAGIRLKAIVA